MNTYLIEGARTIRIEGDEVTTRQDGSLWVLVAKAPKPAPLVAVLVLARGQWHSVLVEGSNILFAGDPPPPPNKPTPTPWAV
jgi:hypothetical protein